MKRRLSEIFIFAPMTSPVKVKSKDNNRKTNPANEKVLHQVMRLQIPKNVNIKIEIKD